MSSIEAPSVIAGSEKKEITAELGSRVGSELKERVGRELREGNFAERKKLLRVGFEETHVKGLNDLRKNLINASSDRPSFEQLAYKIIEDDPELTVGLTASEIRDGVEYLYTGEPPGGRDWWDPLKPKPIDVAMKDLRPVGIKDWLRRKGTDKALGAIEKRLSWYLRLPYRMIKKRLGRTIEDLAKPKGKDDLPGPKDDPKATSAREGEKPKTREPIEREAETVLLQTVRDHGDELRGLRADLKKLQDDLAKEVKGATDLAKLKEYFEKHEERRKKIETTIDERESERGEALSGLLRIIESKYGQGGPQQIGQQNYNYNYPPPMPGQGGQWQWVPQAPGNPPAAASASPRGPESVKTSLDPAKAALDPQTNTAALDAQKKKLDSHPQRNRVDAVLNQWKQNKPMWRRALWSTLTIGAGVAAAAVTMPFFAPGAIAFAVPYLTGAASWAGIGLSSKFAAGAVTGALGGAISSGIRSGVHIARASRILQKQNPGEKLVGKFEYFAKRTAVGLGLGGLFGGILEQTGGGQWLREKTATGLEMAKGWGKGAWETIKSWIPFSYTGFESAPMAPAATVPAHCEALTRQLDGLMIQQGVMRMKMDALIAEMGDLRVATTSELAKARVDIGELKDLISKLPEQMQEMLSKKHPSVYYFLNFGTINIDQSITINPSSVDPVLPSPAPSTPEPIPPAVEVTPRWKGFSIDAVRNPSEGWEQLIRAMDIDVSQLKFGSGKPSPMTAIFRDIMASNPDASTEFFSGSGRMRTVSGIGTTAFEEVATKLRDGVDILNYEVLNQKFGGSKLTLLERMTERSTQLFGTDDPTTKAFQTAQAKFNALAPGAKLRVGIYGK